MNEQEFDDQVLKIYREMRDPDTIAERVAELQDRLDELVNVPLERRSNPDQLTDEELLRVLKVTAPEKYFEL